MTDIAIVQDTVGRIAEQFEMPNLPQATDADAFLKKLHRELSERIAYMLEHESEHLKWVLYRIDINEQKVLSILAEQPLYEAVESIAQLIIDRQIQKSITRKQYSTGNGDLSFDIDV